MQPYPNITAGGVDSNYVRNYAAGLDKKCRCFVAGTGMSCLEWALCFEDIPTAEWLVERGLSLEDEYLQLLALGYPHNLEGAFAFMLEHGIDANGPVRGCATGLHYIAINSMSHDVEAIRSRIRLFTARGVAIDAGDECGVTPMIYSMLTDDRPDKDVISAFVMEGADVCLIAEGRSCLHLCVDTRGMGDILRLMLRQAACVDVLDSDGNSPLMRACAGWPRDDENIQILLDAGANPNLVNSAGESAIWNLAVDSVERDLRRIASSKERSVEQWIGALMGHGARLDEPSGGAGLSLGKRILKEGREYRIKPAVIDAVCIAMNFKA